MKRILSFLLAFMMIVSITASITVANAENEPITVVKAVRFSDTNELLVTFSKPVHIGKNSHIHMRTSPTEGVGRDVASVKYVGPNIQRVNVASSELPNYSDMVLFKFNNSPPSNCGFVITEYNLAGVSGSTQDGKISTTVISGINGEAVAGNYQSGGIDFLYIPYETDTTPYNTDVKIKTVNKDIELISVEKDADSNTFTATFSKPVHLNKDVSDTPYDYFKLRKTATETPQVFPQSVTYIDSHTTNGLEYSNKIKFVYSSLPNSQSYGFDIVEYYVDSGTDNYISNTVIMGEDGEFVKGTYKNGIDFLWVPTDAADSGNTYAKHIDVVSYIIDVLSVEKDRNSNSFTVTFSKPVHLNKDINSTPYDYFKLRKTATETPQVFPQSVTYIDSHTTNGLEYSNKIKFVYSSLPNSQSYGFDIVEYFVKDANDVNEDVKDGLIAKTVISGENGERVRANCNDGTRDFLWVPTDAADSGNTYNLHITVSPFEIESVEILGTNALFIFKSPVKVNDVSSFELGDGTKGQSYTSASEYSSQINVEFGKQIDSDTFKINENAITDSYGSKVSNAGLLLNFADYKPDYGKDLSEIIENGAKYSFMNCDTGRMITVDGKTEFTITKENGENEYSLSNENGYINLETGVVSSSKFTFKLVCKNEYKRYQIYINRSKVLADDDGGSDNKASLCLKSLPCDVIESGWYITKSGEELPKKIAVVGDSITCGVTPEGSTPKPGCREMFSKNLLKNYGRVVFVGSLKHTAGENTTAINNTTIYDDHLNRHEGHSGWVIHNDPTKSPGADDNNRGIDDDGSYKLISGAMEERHVRKILQEKYNPDVIFMMIGINDLGTNGYSDAMIPTIVDRHNTLVNNILEDLPEDGKLVVASCTPLKSPDDTWNTVRNGIISKFNEAIRDSYREYAENGEDRITFTDNYTYLYNAGTSAISSDKIHPTKVGYTAMAQSYTDKFMNLYANENCSHKPMTDGYIITDEGHYKLCEICGNHYDEANHEFENACDKDCEICKYERDTEHEFIYISNGFSGHTKKCTKCGFEIYEEHSGIICTDCGFVGEKTDGYELIYSEDKTETTIEINSLIGSFVASDSWTKLEKNVQKAIIKNATEVESLAAFDGIEKVYVIGNPTFGIDAVGGFTGTIGGFAGSNVDKFCENNNVNFIAVDEFKAIGMQTPSSYSVEKNKFRIIGNMRWAQYYNTAKYDITAKIYDGSGNLIQSKKTSTNIKTVYKSVSGISDEGVVFDAVTAEKDCYLSAISMVGLPALTNGQYIIFGFTPSLINDFEVETIFKTVYVKYSEDGYEQYIPAEEKLPVMLNSGTTDGIETNWNSFKNK